MNDTDHLYLDRSLMKILSKRLNDITSWLADALDDVVARDTARERNDGGKSADQPLPFHDKAGDAAIELTGTLQAWVDTVSHTRHLPWPGTLRAKQSAHWMKDHIVDLALCTDAFQAFDEISDARKRAVHFADIPMPVEFAGPCQSTTDGITCDGVYCREKTDIHHCSKCNADVDVPALQATMIETMQHRLFDADELQDALTIAGKKRIHRRTIKSWIDSERLVARGGKYLLADALVLLAQHKPKTRTTKHA
ncbi:hypothetical protein KXR83_05700 [Williamsia muralis]|uniref:hypothetical protein n=1 Tax=Williamsia marianensis TaxID=85044 RepID=UPI003F1687FC